MLGLVISFKTIFVFFILFYLLRKKWDIVVYSFLTILASVVATVFISSTFLYEYYVRKMLPTLFGTSGAEVYYNQGFLGFVSRLFSNTQTRQLVTPILSLIVIASTIFSALKARVEDENLVFSLLITTLLLVDRLSWQHHFVWLIFPFVVLAKYAINKKEKIYMGILVIAYILVSWNFRNPNLFLEFPLVLLLSNTFYGTLLLFILNIILLLDRSTDSTNNSDINLQTKAVIKTIKHNFIKYPKTEAIKGIYYGLRFLFNWRLKRNHKIKNINAFEYRGYSQNREDGLLQIIFHKIGITNKFYVELGAEDGSECNTRFLKEFYSWEGLLIDTDSRGSTEVKEEFVNKDNIEELLSRYKVPRRFDLLSFDIDGNDYWVWESIKRFKPRVVVVEYNSIKGYKKSLAIKYDPNFIYEGTDYFGASLKALVDLGKLKGYTIVGCDENGVSAFFVKDGLMENNFFKKGLKDIYRPPKYGNKQDGKYIGYKNDSRKMITV